MDRMMWVSYWAIDGVVVSLVEDSSSRVEISTRCGG